jgi:hypothetical protein
MFPIDDLIDRLYREAKAFIKSSRREHREFINRSFGQRARYFRRAIKKERKA